MSESAGRDGKVREFNHPFLQSAGMFFGEFTCLIAFKLAYHYYLRKGVDEDAMPASVKGSRTYNPFIFVAPAVCDLIATSTMYVGLTMTYASSFQMLRGALIVFTGLLSTAFLNRKLKNYEWTGIFFVITGLVVVGLSDFVTKSESSHGRNSMITGDLLIVIAQVITATQMVVEERFVTSRNVSPLEAVGWEGLFGFIIMTLLLVPFYFITVGNQIFKNPGGQLEDAIDGAYQIVNNWQVATGFLGTIISISFFNFAGISVTKEISATTRTVLDSIRTFIIWLFSLAVGWQSFSWLQLLGFIVLITGMFLYNNVVILPLIRKVSKREQDREQIIPHTEQDAP